MNRRYIPGPNGWSIDYVRGARLADIRYMGHAVDCVQVREWDFSLSEQTSHIPSDNLLGKILLDYFMEHGEGVA
jgi:hypothetical protein